MNLAFWVSALGKDKKNAMKTGKTYALLALFCIIITMAARAQERQEFKFENGIKVYSIKVEKEWYVEDEYGKVIVPQRPYKIMRKITTDAIKYRDN